MTTSNPIPNERASEAPPHQPREQPRPEAQHHDGVARTASAMVAERGFADARQAVHERCAPAIEVDRAPTATARDAREVRRRRERVERPPRRRAVHGAARRTVDAV